MNSPRAAAWAVGQSYDTENGIWVLITVNYDTILMTTQAARDMATALLLTASNIERDEAIQAGSPTGETPP